LVLDTEVPKSFLEPMGYLTIWFSLLEREIDEAIASFLHVHWALGIAVTAQFTSFAGKCRLLRTLVDLQGEDGAQKDFLLTIVDAAKDVNSRRNELIHGDWFVLATSPPGGITKVSMKAEGKLKDKFSHFTPEKVMEVARDSQAIARKVPNAVSLCPRNAALLETQVDKLLMEFRNRDASP